jgi:hypothetical protein
VKAASPSRKAVSRPRTDSPFSSPLLVEPLVGTGDQELPAGPVARARDAQDWQPGVLGQDGAEAAARGADHREWAIAEDARDVAWRARQPVDGVFDDAGDAVVILGRGQQLAVASQDPCLGLGHGRR